MRKIGKLQNRWRMAAGMLVLMAALAIMLFADTFSIVSYAASAGKVTSTSAKVRKEPSTKSETLASLAQDAAITIKGQTKASDGYTWYQIEVDGNKTGYVRSDLVSITDGTTPPTIAPTTTGNNTTPATPVQDESVVSVTELEPVSASVSGGSKIRVRQNASTTSRIVSTVESGLALTVNGVATGTDGNTWYRVNFISNGAEINGFIRSDYVPVKPENLVPAGTGTPSDTTVPDDTTPAPAETAKEWDTFYEGGKWHLVNNVTGKSYDPQAMLDSVEANTKTLNDTLSKNKTQQAVIIILVILMIGLAAAISFLIFKIKDMTDSAYYNQVEREAMHRRTADRPQGSGQKVMHSVGANGRPAGQRPSGGGNGQRPAGQRPSGGGNGQRPAGQRPSGGGNGQRPAGQSRPVENNGGVKQHPVNPVPEQEQPQQQNAAQPPQQQAQQQAPAPAAAPVQQEKAPSRKPRNFMKDDEEFEFKFLDWDGKDE